MRMRFAFLFTFFVAMLFACNVEQPAADLGADVAAPADMKLAVMCGLQPAQPELCEGKADGELCDDGDACTHGDACKAGVCISEMPGRHCVRCRVDADCCAGIGSISCDDSGNVWAPTGKCLADGVCAMDRKGCLVGEVCIQGQGCK